MDTYSELGLFNFKQQNDEHTLDFCGNKIEIEKKLLESSYEILTVRNMTLNDIFVSRSSADMGAN